MLLQQFSPTGDASLAPPPEGSGGRKFLAVLADSDDLKERLFRFRYEVYVEILGRRQVHANHLLRMIEEPMDENGKNYLAMIGDDVVGSIRSNLLSDPAMDYYAKLYGAEKFDGLNTDATQITTKLMVLPKVQRTTVAARLIRHYATCGHHRGLTVDLLDCNKPLIEFFERMGYFRYRGWTIHKEFGAIMPMFLATDTLSYQTRIKSILAETATDKVEDDQYGGRAFVERHALMPLTPHLQVAAKTFFPNLGVSKSATF